MNRSSRNWPAVVQGRLTRRGIARQLHDLSGADTEGRYIPTPDELTARPTAGEFYHVKRGDTVSAIARSAYGDGGKVGQLRINNSTWNDHVEKGSAGWTHLKIKGLQLLAKYAGPPAPRAGKGSGKSFPVLWIPPLSGDEPEVVKKPKAPAAVVKPKAPAAVVKPKAPAYEPEPVEPAAIVRPAAVEPEPVEPAAVEVIRPVTVEPEFVPLKPVITQGQDDNWILPCVALAILIM